MIELLKKIYHKLSDYKIVQWAGHLYANGSPIGNYKAYLRLKNLSKQQKQGGRIRVVFLGQNASVWNKLQSVYEKMEEDDRFEVSLLAIPEHIASIDTKSFDYFFHLSALFNAHC
jgi:hypothetical protein